MKAARRTLLALTCIAAFAGNAPAHFPATTRTPELARWETLRFGAFVHYNMNTYGPMTSDGLIDDYFGGDCRNPDLFHPEHLDVAGWIRGLKDAGVRYAVLTARHIGGFLLWDSTTSDYTSMHSRGVERDIVREFVTECRKQGVMPGLYYLMGGGKHDGSSCPVNHHPFDRQTVIDQLTELATRYGEVPYFWIDMMDWRPIRAAGDAQDLTTQEVYDLIKSYQPHAIVIFNQHVEHGTRIHYFPTDAVNGEETAPAESGYDPAGNELVQAPSSSYERETDDNSGYAPRRYYLPFEFSMTGQISPQEIHTTPVGAFHDTLWFTRSQTHSESARTIYVQARNALEHGAANLLLAAAPDESGSMKAEDLDQLKILGGLIGGHAGLAIEPGSWVSRVERLGATIPSASEARCRIEVGASPVRVTKLGRFGVSDRSAAHELSLRTLSGERVAHVVLDANAPSRPDLNGFEYAALEQPVTLAARTQYEIVSTENGDPSYGAPDDPARLVVDGRVRVLGSCAGPLNLVLDSSGVVGAWDLSRRSNENLADTSGHGNTARRHGVLNGKNGYVAIPNSGTLDIEGKIALEARIRPNRIDGIRNIIAKGYTLAPPREVTLRIRDGRYEVGSWDGGSPSLASSAVPSEDLHQWVDLTGLYDGASWKLYRNGKLVASQADSRGAVSVPADWAIGGCSRGWCASDGTRGFDGEIATVRISRDARPPRISRSERIDN